MCLSSSSKSSSASSTSTVNRDERIGLDGGSSSIVVKDLASGGHSSATVNVTDMSPEVFSLAQGFLSDAMQFMAGATQGAVNFARETQAAYADVQADTSTADLKEVIEKGIQALMVIAGLYVALQVIK